MNDIQHDVAMARLGAYLRAAREEAGLTQEQLAERARTHRPVIARLERGAHAPRLDTILRVAEALDLRLRISLEPGEPTHALSSEPPLVCGPDCKEEEA